MAPPGAGAGFISITSVGVSQEGGKAAFRMDRKLGGGWGSVHSCFPREASESLRSLPSECFPLAQSLCQF